MIAFRQKLEKDFAPWGKKTLEAIKLKHKKLLTEAKLKSNYNQFSGSNIETKLSSVWLAWLSHKKGSIHRLEQSLGANHLAMMTIIILQSVSLFIFISCESHHLPLNVDHNTAMKSKLALQSKDCKSSELLVEIMRESLRSQSWSKRATLRSNLIFCG